MKHYPVGTWVGSLWYTIKVAHQARAYPGIVAWSGQEYFYSSLDGILVHGRVIPPPPRIKFTGIHSDLGGASHCEWHFIIPCTVRRICELCDVAHPTCD